MGIRPVVYDDDNDDDNDDGVDDGVDDDDNYFYVDGLVLYI